MAVLTGTAGQTALGAQLVGVKKFYVLHITETGKIWALAGAEQHINRVNCQAKPE